MTPSIIHFGIGIFLAAKLTVAASATEVFFDGKMLSLENTQGNLADTLEVVADRLGAGLQIRGELGPVRTTSWPPDEPGQLLRELVRPHTLILRYNSETGAPSEIIVRQSRAGERQSRRIHASDYKSETSTAQILLRSGNEQSFKNHLRKLLKTSRAKDAREIAKLAVGVEKPEMRRLALVALTRIGGPEAQTAMRNGLHDEHAHIRLQAARGLANLLGAGARRDLITAMRREEDESVQKAMQRLLANI